MRLSSYINAVYELRWDFHHQDMPDDVYVEVDSDGARCPRTRRSTSGDLVFWWGKHFAGQLLSATAHEIAQQR